MDVARRAWLPGRVDLLTALGPALVGGVVVALAGSAVGGRAVLPVVALDTVVVLLTTLPVLWCRAAPVVVAVALAVVSVATYVVDDLLLSGASMWGIAFLTGLVASLPVAYQVARHRPWSVLVATLAILVAPNLGIVLVTAATSTSPPLIVFMIIIWFVLADVALLAPAWGVGLAHQRRARRAAERVRRNAEHAEHAVRGERARVMRELQGLVLADLASIGQQAEHAGHVLADTRPGVTADADTRAALLSITTTGRDTLTAMRRLLGMLRGSGEDPVQAPQPTMDRLDELVEVHRRAGLDVRLTVSGERRPLPDDVDLAAYRVLQRVLEGSRDAGPVRLQVTYGDRALRLGAHGDLGDGGGLTVREWVRFAGGEVSVLGGLDAVAAFEAGFGRL